MIDQEQVISVLNLAASLLRQHFYAKAPIPGDDEAHRMVIADLHDAIGFVKRLGALPAPAASEGLLSEAGADALAVTCGLRIIEGGYKGRRVAWMNFALELHRILVRAALREET